MPYESQNTTDRPLRVFLCHSSNDKPAVRELYQKLRSESWIQPWLDEEELYPGQDWNMEIEKAVETADAIIVCLTKGSITKEGYVQRELRIVLDFADYKPEGTLYIIPVRLEECEPPRRLRAWQYADYFEGQRERALERLLVSLKRRADSLDLKLETSAQNTKEAKEKPIQEEKSIIETPFSKQEETAKNSFPPITSWPPLDKVTLSNGIEFMRMPAGKFLMGSGNGDANETPQHTVDILYDYWMARYPVTNELYNAFAKAKGIKHPIDGLEKKKDHPVVQIKWTDAMEYCQWLNNFLKAKLPSGLVLRLPTEAEWEKVARGTDGREYPWGNEFDKNKCNSDESRTGDTTPVGLYSPHGDSPFGCADMAGNVWEWTHSAYKSYPYSVNDGREDEGGKNMCVLRGGSYRSEVFYLRCTMRYRNLPDATGGSFGFRVCLAPPLPK
ncbi:MAG: SUMF1/EgtB/PvdO family nonheme iron enzyme [Anaerolineales bacterium]|nr:SUMF1/EgtB/PvdO family nonheme iron enzyme [Anaerolineales bacterium]